MPSSLSADEKIPVNQLAEIDREGVYKNGSFTSSSEFIERIVGEFPTAFVNSKLPLKNIGGISYRPHLSDKLKPFYHQPTKLGAFLNMMRGEIKDESIGRCILEKVSPEE